MKQTALCAVLFLLTAVLAAGAEDSQRPIRLGRHFAVPEPLPVPDGVYEVTLSLHGNGGGLLWEQSYLKVPIRSGSIEARFLGPPDDVDLSGAWLEILVDGQALGSAAVVDSPGGAFSLALTDTGAKFTDHQSQLSVAVGLANYPSHQLFLWNGFGEVWISTGETGGALDRVGVEADGRMQILGGSNADLLDGTGYLIIGRDEQQNLVLDDNEIQARNNGVAANLFLQHQGGNIWFQGAPIHESDRRTKRGIHDLQVGLEEVLRLRPISFEWKDRPGPRRPGFIAQEARDVLADLVTEDEEGTLGLAYSSLIPVLVRAIQEQQAEIEELRADLEALRVQAPGRRHGGGV